MRSKLSITTTGLLALGVIILSACQSKPKSLTTAYEGAPYTDSVYKTGIQSIPGRLECEYFDLGGEGVAYHDSDSSNSGSGALNPADGSYLHEFRINEAVDISYVKFDLDPQIDDNPFNFVTPEKEQLYVGWTEPGEWINYTIKVEESGTYTLGLMYTANQDGQISLSLNNLDITGPITVPSTFVMADSVDWRQWHHWNYLDNMATVKLEKGEHILTLHTLAVGQMNYEHIDFKLAEE